MTNILYRIRSLTISAFVVTFGAASASAISYTLTDLGIVSAYGLNASGQVVGEFMAQNAFTYSGNTVTDLGIGSAYAVNASGQVAGSDASGHAVIWSGNSVTDLGTLGGQYSTAWGINDLGQVTGESWITGSQDGHAFFYSGGSMIDIGTLGGSQSSGRGINSSGQITGYADLLNGYQRAFLYSGGTMADLGTLGGTRSLGSAINSSGQVTGYAFIAGDQTFHAFIYSGGSMIDLGTLGGQHSMGFAINSLGQVTGTAETPGNTDFQHAFLYSNGTMLDLNSLIDPNAGWTLTHGFGINDAGQIIGWGRSGQSYNHSFLLTPISGTSSSVPDAGLGLVGIGALLGVCAIGRKQMKS